MSSHNIQNTTITQHMSVLGSGAGCWFPSSQLPPTAPIRQKRQPTHQPLTVQHVMQQLQGSAPPPSQQPLSPKAPNGPHIGGHFNHHNPHASMASSGVHPSIMSTSAQGMMLAAHNPGLANGAMATSLHSMPGLHQQGHHIQHHQVHSVSIAGGIPQQQQQHTTVIMQQQHLQQQQQQLQQQQQQQQQQQLPDINSIQQGLPQPLRTKGTELRPSNMPWHHGKITRDRAEQLLHPRADGLFLVRESTNFPGDQTLCVCFQGRVEHYRIKCGAHSTLTIDDEEFFDTLPQLIDHYLQDADGLCTQLVKCLPKQQPPLMTSNQLPPTTTTTAIPQPSIPQQAPNLQQKTTALQQQQQMIQQQQQMLQQQTQILQPQAQILQQGQILQPAAQLVQGQMLQGQMLQQGQPSQIIQHPPTNEQNMPPCLAPQAFVDAGWMISERDLEIRENIGKGEFGDVMLGILSGQRVAVKMLKDSEAASKFLAEASLMTSLKHENLVKLLGLVFNKQHICLVTEYMSKGSLVDYLRSRGRLHVTKRDQIHFAFDTCSGMEYLEARRVVHRDLAARNVLVSDSGRAKVADFGLAREEGGPEAHAKLPIKWTAPEALKHNKFSNKSDMWSFGILLWEIYSFGRVPYPRIPLADVVKHVEKGYKMEAPEGCPPELYELMRQAWDLNPDTRPTFSQAKGKLAILKASTPAV